MARDVSIAISAKDNFSQAITTMRNANQSFNKDLTGLQSKLNELNKTKAVLKVDTKKAKEALKEAEKQFEKTGNAADKFNLELANADYENARRNLSLVSDNAKKAEKEMRNLTDTTSKFENRASSLSSNSSTGLLKSLAASGATQMLGNMLGDVATTWVGSAYGAEASTLTSSMLSSGAMGAAIGSAIAPGIGTAIGALGGAVIGYIQGNNAIFEGKDDAFKSYYEELYNEALDSQSQALTSGIGIASSREANRISFSTLLGGESKANEYLGSLTEFASVTPFSYDELTNISKVLLAYGYKQDELLPLLEKVGNAGSALGMSSEDMKYVATALGRMQTTGKTTLEYLNPLLERGIDVWSYLAEASGRTKTEVQEMVSKGLVPGEEAAKAIADYMGGDFAGNMEKQAQTYAGLLSTLEDANAELENAMGEGYNSTRKRGLQDQIDWLSGESGNEMEEAYNYIGQWKASLENLSEQYQRDALNAVMNGTISAQFSPEVQDRLTEMYEQYTRYSADGSEEAGAKIGALLAEAQAIATNEYNASEGAQLALESNKTLAENIKNDTSAQDAYWDAGYQMGQQFSKGMASAIETARSEVMDDAESYYEELINDDNLTAEQKTLIKGNKGRVKAYYAQETGKSPAYGLNYVPYNNYPALLHEGERVLTASENRSNNNSKEVPINISGNTFIVRSEEDVKEVAREVANLIRQAYVLAP